MKIFGKRTKKPVSAEEAAKLALISEADKAALELLKKDPSTLNAKQRRMIKRYEERREEEKEVEEKQIDDVDSGEGDDENSAENNEAAKAENEGESGSSVNESSDDDEGDKPPTAKKTKTKKSSNFESTPPIAVAESCTVEAQVDDATEQVQDIKEAEDSKPTATVPTATVSSDEEAEILRLVASLNSKNRRKLTRQLEREGPSALAAVKEEALKLAEEGKPVEEVPPEPVPKGKKRKVDWSALTPEERMRRQDQQRKQQEAAEKRAKGESSEGAHKHALNSERRRANKRKPKWQRMGAPLNTHDTSGFQMRKSSTKVGSGKVVAKT